MKALKNVGNFVKSIGRKGAEGAAQGTQEQIRDTFEAVNENIAPPVTPSTTKPQPSQATQSNPQPNPEKKQVEEVRKRNLLDFLRRYQQNESSVAQKKMHEEQLKKQQETKLAEEKKIKQFEIVKQQNQKQAVFQAQRKTEMKKGGF